MDTPGTKPAYHHPMPWQTVVALVFIGLDALALLLMASGLAAVAGSAPRQVQGLLLFMTVPVVLGAIVFTVLGICIAVRLNKARKIAVVLNFFFLIAAIAVLIVLGIVGEFNPAALFSGALSFFMISLLSNERSQAYTYKDGEGGWPED